MIGEIQNGEAGISVRQKLNQLILKTNLLSPNPNWADIVDKPSTFPSVAPNWADIVNKPSTFPSVAPNWADIVDKPSTFPSNPSGTDTQVQFNDGGAFGADAGLTYNKTTDALSVTGSVIVPVVAAASSGNVNLILSPIGTGAIQLQIADNTATGGNARGQFAVDLQRARNAATNVASGNYSFITGQNNAANGENSCAIGSSNTASGFASFALGTSNFTTANDCFALGNGAFARLQSQFALGARLFSAAQKSQYNIFLVGGSTTNATPTVLTTQLATQITLQNNSAMRFNILVIANVTGGGNTSGWDLRGVIKRGANAASTALVGTVTTTLVGQDAEASGWAIAATANTTTGGLTITATGQAGTTIRWVATVESAEVAF